MNLKLIYDQLGLDAVYEEEVVSFTERLLIVLDGFRSQLIEGDVYDRLYGVTIGEFAFLIGESHYYRQGFRGNIYLPFTDFFKKGGSAVLRSNIKRLTLLLMATKKTIGLGFYQEHHKTFSRSVSRLFETTPIDIGYVFTGETIVQKGAEELDRTLILDTLKWLSDYPNTQSTFQTALTRYLSSDFPDAVTNCYSALEGMSRTLVGKDKRLDTKETRAELIKALALKNDWAQLLYHYSQLAHDLSSRHGKPETVEAGDIAPELAEFYVYFTGAFLRLIVQRMKNKE
jgi:hypothetical protein